MSVTFQESETLQNLMRAFAGESQAQSRYVFAAELARQQKLPVAEAVFLFTAQQECAHAKVFYQHLSALSGETIPAEGSWPVDLGNDLLLLLRAAQHNEFQEWQDVYPAFADAAQQEGFPQAEQSFRQIALIEKSHGQRFGRLADLLEEGKLFLSDAACGWMCLNCGHILNAAEAPKQCPVCHHEQGYFIRLELAPWTDR